MKRSCDPIEASFVKAMQNMCGAQARQRHGDIIDLKLTQPKRRGLPDLKRRRSWSDSDDESRSPYRRKNKLKMLGPPHRTQSIEDKHGEAFPSQACIAASTATAQPCTPVRAQPAQVAGGTAAAVSAAADTAAERNDSIKDSAAAIGESAGGGTALKVIAKICKTIKAVSYTHLTLPTNR